MAGKVLIIEDDPDTVRLVELYLARDGHKVLAATDGLEGLRLAREAKPDLIVLDLMLPGMDGMEICRTLREESMVPIVMLTARVEEKDRLVGLDLGADDYVSKPFSPKELAARVRAVMRRTAREALDRGPEEISHGNVTVNVKRHVVRIGDNSVSLTPTEFRFVTLFVREPGRTFTREQIIDRVFGYDFDGFDRTVDAHIANLRRKLGVKRGSPEYIQTVYGVGYRFGDA
jgi:DNA-binding response OmpR family regulator